MTGQTSEVNKCWKVSVFSLPSDMKAALVGNVCAASETSGRYRKAQTQVHITHMRAAWENKMMIGQCMAENKNKLFSLKIANKQKKAKVRPQGHYTLQRHDSAHLRTPL